MDAVEFLKEKERMCKKSSFCGDCPLYSKNSGHDTGCVELLEKYPEESVLGVEKWSKEHPKKTRQGKFLETYPMAKRKSDGTLCICPRHLDDDYKNDHECSWTSCNECRKKYWLAEVE